MIEPEPAVGMVEKVLGIPVGLGLVTLAVRHFIRGLSRDRRDNAGDRGVVELIERQAKRIKELEDANAALSRERNEAVSRVGGMEANIQHLTETVAQLRNEVEQLRVDVKRARTT